MTAQGDNYESGMQPPVGSDLVLLQVDADLAHIRLNRPEVANAMNVQFAQALEGAVTQSCATPGLRAVLLSAAGPNFCASGDVRAFSEQGSRLPGYMGDVLAHFHTAIRELIACQAPVVTLVQGNAVGGGAFGLICASDIVLAASSAQLRLGNARAATGLDGGVSVTLPRLVGLRCALELVLTNKSLTADEAFTAGLVTRVVPDGVLFEEGVRLARQVAAGPTKALAEAKRLVWEGLASRVEERLAEEQRTVSALSGTADAREAFAAFRERREPEFTGC